MLKREQNNSSQSSVFISQIGFLSSSKLLHQFEFLATHFTLFFSNIRHLPIYHALFLFFFPIGNYRQFQFYNKDAPDKAHLKKSKL